MQLVSGQQSYCLLFGAVIAWSFIHYAVCSSFIYSLCSCTLTQKPGQWFYSSLLLANIALKTAALGSCQYQRSTHNI